MYTYPYMYMYMYARRSLFAAYTHARIQGGCIYTCTYTGRPHRRMHMYVCVLVHTPHCHIAAPLAPSRPVPSRPSFLTGHAHGPQLRVVHRVRGHGAESQGAWRVGQSWLQKRSPAAAGPRVRGRREKRVPASCLPSRLTRPIARVAGGGESGPCVIYQSSSLICLVEC